MEEPSLRFRIAAALAVLALFAAEAALYAHVWSDPGHGWLSRLLRLWFGARF